MHFFVRIWHDNRGNSPSWYLNYITVTDIEDETKYYFLCDSWLSTTKGDGKVFVILTFLYISILGGLSGGEPGGGGETLFQKIFQKIF